MIAHFWLRTVECYQALRHARPCAQLRQASCALVLSCMTGCATVHFDNGGADELLPEPASGLLGTGWFISDEEAARASAERQRIWYHHALFGFAELSNPTDAEEVCPGQEWNRFSSEVTPVNVLVGLLDNAILFRAASPALDLWSTWTVEYSCR